MTAVLLTTPLSRFVVLFSILYSSFGVASPYLPSFLASRGLTAEELAVVFAAATAIRLLAAPIAAQLADRLGALRLILSICAVLAAAAALSYLPHAPLPIMLAVGLFHAAALAPTTNLADALALLASKARSGVGFEYGWVRGAGSAAFICGSIVAGVAISAYGLPVILWLQAGLLLAVPWVARRLPSPRSPATQAARQSSLRGILALAGSRAFRRVVLIAALVLGSHAMHDTFAIIRWRAAGVAAWQTSLLWSVAVAAEVLAFFVIGPRLIAYLTPAGTMALAAVCGALRWCVAALTANLMAVALTQLLHGVTFALLHLACMRLIARIVPSQLAATAQAVYGTVGIGVATASLILLSGWLYARLGPPAFLVMSLLSLSALPLSAGLSRILRTDER